MGFTWIEEPTTELILPSGNKMQVRQVDLVALVMSSDNQDIPDDLLNQLGAQLSGQLPDRELVCVKGYQLPIPGEPIQQENGAIRGKVVNVTGTVERFTVRVSMLTTGTFKPGEVRFGGMNMAMLEHESEYVWRLQFEDAEDARQKLPQMGGFINLVARAATVYPKWVNEVTNPETEWPMARVSHADKMYVFSWAMPSEVRPASMFPEEPAADVAAAPDVQGVSPESGDGVRPEASVGEVAV